MTKHAEKHWLPVWERYVISHRRPIVPSFGGIGLLGSLLAEGPVNFVNFCESMWFEGGNCIKGLNMCQSLMKLSSLKGILDMFMQLQ